MITNFEDITEDLSEEELAYKDDIKRYLEAIISTRTVKQNQIVEEINMRFGFDYGMLHFKITATRLRKYFNYFRTNGILPLIATSYGCYISSDKIEIEKQILSMKERARQILRAADGMNKFLI